MAIRDAPSFGVPVPTKRRGDTLNRELRCAAVATSCGPPPNGTCYCRTALRACLTAFGSQQKHALTERGESAFQRVTLAAFATIFV